MITVSTNRPRNVDAPRAAAILYGDWGTSKAYVIGLAFAVAGYSSFWLIAAMCVLTALVGINYIIICRHYPDGGGVYASVRHRSEVISIVGAFLLVADYLVTALVAGLLFALGRWAGWTASAQLWLLAGFTSVRDVGSSDFLDIGLRNAINAGVVLDHIPLSKEGCS